MGLFYVAMMLQVLIQMEMLYENMHLSDVVDVTGAEPDEDAV